MAPDPELALLVACAGWPPSPGRVEAVRAAADGVDWDRFVRLVARHRMAGMAVHGLSAAGVKPPADPDGQLRRAAHADLVQALNTAREAVRLVALLSAAGIAASVLKGPPLAALIYGTLAVRQVRDLDLLVAPADLGAALDLIRAEGYGLAYDASEGGMRPDQSAVLKDVELVHPTTGLLVELHARLTSNDEFLPAAIAGASEPVAVGAGLTLPALTGEPLLVYLAVHGFRHSWTRLKWLADVAAMIGALTPVEVDGLLASMRSRGLYVVAASTLLVLRDVMGIGLPEGMEREARANRRARLCAAVAVRQLRDEREPDRHTLLNTATAATLLLASPSPRYLRREVARVLVDYPFALRFGGGRGALALSVALRPFLWGGRKLANLARETSGPYK